VLAELSVKNKELKVLGSKKSPRPEETIVLDSVYLPSFILINCEINNLYKSELLVLKCPIIKYFTDLSKMLIIQKTEMTHYLCFFFFFFNIDQGLRSFLRGQACRQKLIVRI
jgi:hypothetical protein